MKKNCHPLEGIEIRDPAIQVGKEGSLTMPMSDDSSFFLPMGIDAAKADKKFQRFLHTSMHGKPPRPEIMDYDFWTTRAQAGGGTLNPKKTR